MRTKSYYLGLSLIGLALVESMACSDSSTTSEGPQTTQGTQPVQTPAEYAYQTAVNLTQFVNNPLLGGRNAGSDAEHQAAQYLAEQMRIIGLQDVAAEPFSCAKWQFNSSELTVQGTSGKLIHPYSYASGNTPAAGITAPLVYVGKGAAADYQGLDVTGKIVLADLNMREDWWISFPLLQAAAKNAAALIVSTTGGYAEINDDAINMFDPTAPVTIPAVGISRNDASYLKNLLQQGPRTVTLKVDNIVNSSGTSHNVIGKIPGKSQSEQIVIGDHYDTHFFGFLDDSTGTALTLAIAKTLIESHYQPEHTLIFVLHGAEEFGAIDTRYDWSVGAWNQVNRVHPEWVGRTLAYINLELPGYAFGPRTYFNATPELKSFLSDFVASAPQPSGVYPQGIDPIAYPQTTWSDDWSYSVSGIPAMVNGFDEDGLGNETNFNFTAYHTQFDRPDLYNANAMDFNLRFYTALLKSFDQIAITPLNFAHQAQRVKDAVNEQAYQRAHQNPVQLINAADSLHTTAYQVYDQIKQLNTLYLQLKQNPSAHQALITSIEATARTTNLTLLTAFKAGQDGLMRLDWTDSPIVGHEAPQANIVALSNAIENLQNSRAEDALNTDLASIENEYYSFFFDKAVIQHFTDQVLSPSNQGNLNWGSVNGQRRIVSVIDLYDTIQSIQSKAGSSGASYTQELATLRTTLDAQKVLLQQQTTSEIAVLNGLRQSLSQLDLSGLILAARRELGQI